jgi:ABC-type uncharacterized transport system permease subunit
VRGALGSGEAIGFTLFYATSFVFTGLAVSVPFQSGLFNIGGEGQALIGGIALALVCLAFDGQPLALVLPLAVLAAMAGGAAWAFIPAWLQASRGSHIVITTIMFNFIAASLGAYLLVDVLIAPGQASPETRGFDPSLALPFLHEIATAVGIPLGRSPLNISVFLAVAASVAAGFLIRQTRLGFEIRATGGNPEAARYGGISSRRAVLVSVCLGGALAGMMALNEIMGFQHRLVLNYTAGYGFIGIAVALLGRNRPLGILLAAVLFGALYQGGSELAFDMPGISRELIAAVEGLVLLFCGALERMFRPAVAAILGRPPEADGPAPRQAT